MSSFYRGGNSATESWIIDGVHITGSRAWLNSGSLVPKSWPTYYIYYVPSFRNLWEKKTKNCVYGSGWKSKSWLVEKILWHNFSKHLLFSFKHMTEKLVDSYSSEREKKVSPCLWLSCYTTCCFLRCKMGQQIIIEIPFKNNSQGMDLMYDLTPSNKIHHALKRSLCPTIAVVFHFHKE